MKKILIGVAVGAVAALLVRELIVFNSKEKQSKNGKQQNDNSLINWGVNKYVEHKAKQHAKKELKKQEAKNAGQN
ncbi:MAG: hypothetical protein ACE5IR_11820 [bacterium]